MPLQCQHAVVFRYTRRDRESGRTGHCAHAADTSDFEDSIVGGELCVSDQQDRRDVRISPTNVLNFSVPPRRARCRAQCSQAPNAEAMEASSASPTANDGDL